MKELIVKVIKKALKKDGVEIGEGKLLDLIETPPSPSLGDYSFPCFFLAEFMKESPSDIAIRVRRRIGDPPKGFEDIKTEGAYINFYLDRKKITMDLINAVLEKKDNFGRVEKIKEKVMIEFSQPNTHKAFHIGHIRGTSIGESLSRIVEFCGNKVIRANYQGDSGMHVAKWLWCYRKYHSKEKIRKEEKWIAAIYVDAVKKLSKDKKGKFKKEVEEINRKLGTGEDKKLDEIWKKTREMSLQCFEDIYSQLNTRFDVYFFESKMNEGGIQAVDMLLLKKIAKVSEGAVIVDLEKYGLGIWVLLRKDKTPLYSSKDLALALNKFKKFDIKKSFYVIGAAQSLHMKQLFKTLELMKFKRLNDCSYITFSEVRLPGQKISSRTGKNLLYSDFIKEIKTHAKREIKKRNPKINSEELEKRALLVSIAAIKYSMLKQNPGKSIVFRKKEALNFEGDTGSYLLYTYARANSILKKAKNRKLPEKVLESLEEEEVDLVKKMMRFQDAIYSSYVNLNPSFLANYSYQLSKIFNEFYHACPVIGSDNEKLRLDLVKAFRYILGNSLNLLGIEPLEEM